MTATMKPKKKPDRHKSAFLIRLPEAYRPVVREICKANRRAITAEIQIALDKHIRSEGREPPSLG